MALRVTVPLSSCGIKFGYPHIRLLFGIFGTTVAISDDVTNNIISWTELVHMAFDSHHAELVSHSRVPHCSSVWNTDTRYKEDGNDHREECVRKTKAWWI